MHTTPYFGYKLGKLIIFSKETGFPDLSSLISLFKPISPIPTLEACVNMANNYFSRITSEEIEQYFDITSNKGFQS